ncbi:TetR/AcrR family transcriptional regulator [Niallia sp. Krafla_26]|uniref:TetR/AcrR family transcriptional regulator n=1 Tax=Niallia sp. Krafla_26 TaxID=3064703 RepID=UPI003D16D640
MDDLQGSRIPSSTYQIKNGNQAKSMETNQENDLSKKDLILKVTLDLIKEQGFEGITVRKIAKVANVNVALINYYFGCKDKLLNEVIQLLVSSFQDSFNILDNQALEPKERLKQFLINYINAFHKYPFIGRKLVTQEPLRFDSHQEYITFIKSIGIQKLRTIIQEISGETDQQKLTIMITHLLGAVFLPTLIEPVYEQVTGYPFSNIETRVDILIDQYFSKL